MEWVVEYLGTSIMGFGSIVVDEINVTTLCIWKTFHCNPLEFPHLIILVYNDVFGNVIWMKLRRGHYFIFTVVYC